MGARTNYYVNPAINANSGTGSSGDPFGDLQYALNTVTRNSTNGDQFNIKAGTDEVLSSALTLATYGTPSASAPLVFQGYTSTVGDGGQGSISGNGSVGIFTTGENYICWRDLKLYNCGAANILTVDFGILEHCELSLTTGSGISSPSAMGIFNCYFTDIGTNAVENGSALITVIGCYMLDGATHQFARAINIVSGANIIRNNIISLNTAAGIGIVAAGGHVAHNSIYNAAAGTGKGIWINAPGTGMHATVFNNLIEGFSGSGGKALQVDGTYDIMTYMGNAYYNNTTNESITPDAFSLGDNESLSASPFAKSGTNSYALRSTYFAPQNTGNVRGGAYPTTPTGTRYDKGAVQHQDAAGGPTPKFGRGVQFKGAIA